MGRYAQQAHERNAAKVPLLDMSLVDAEENPESVLTTDWHPFYDARGVKFYHNFCTGERMRQSPRRVPNTADPGAEPAPALPDATSVIGGGSTTTSKLGSLGGTTKNMATTSPLPLSGFDSLETYPCARDNAAMQKDLRDLRPPHRVHMP